MATCEAREDGSQSRCIGCDWAQRKLLVAWTRHLSTGRSTQGEGGGTDWTGGVIRSLQVAMAQALVRCDSLHACSPWALRMFTQHGDCLGIAWGQQDIGELEPSGGLLHTSAQYQGADC